MKNKKKSPIRSDETHCSVTGTCKYNAYVAMGVQCLWFNKWLQHAPDFGASSRLKECTDTDPVFKKYWKGTINNEEFTRNNELQEFCLNSRRWIAFMSWPPKSCPYEEKQLSDCENCGYYELRNPSSRFKRKMKIIKELDNE